MAMGIIPALLGMMDGGLANMGMRESSPLWHSRVDFPSDYYESWDLCFIMVGLPGPHWIDCRGKSLDCRFAVRIMAWWWA
jgi:hypothetical protein